MISSARQGFDPQDGRPVVNIGFDSNGTRRFARVTQENVGKPFAIILDNVVLSAPNIHDPILGGSAQISGSFTAASAGNSSNPAPRIGDRPPAARCTATVADASATARPGQCLISSLLRPG